MTTETRTVTVGSVAKKTGTTNGKTWTRYSLMDDDDKFVGSTFDKHIFDALENYGGKAIEVDLEVRDGERGKLYDLKAVRLANGNGAAPSPAEKHSTIVREVALKAAVDLAHQVIGDGVTVESVLIVADKFVAWINGETPEDGEIPF